MKNRYIKILCIFAVIIASATGCSKKLDTIPFNQIAKENAFDTPARCLLALNGVYDAAQSGVYDPLNGTATVDRGYPFGAAAIEQEEMRGEDCVNIQTFFSVTYLSQHSTTSPNNVNMWSNLYALINKANISIAGFQVALGKGVLTTSVEAQYEGECKFMRAMAHHELLIHFARPYADGAGSKLGVPYRDFPIDGPEALARVAISPRESVAACYTKMLADLDYAELNLPASGAGLNTIRATKAAAIALKMRLKLHKGDWAGVIAEGNKLIPATIVPQSWTTVVSPIGGWALTAAPDGPFLNNLSTESIFSIRNDANDNPGTNGALSRMFGSVTSGGRGLISLSPILYNMPQWTCTDKRRALTADGASAITTASKFCLKYRDFGTYSDFAPYIRYAEVLLMQAEADARNTPAVVSARSLDLLNTVRNRSLALPLTETYTAANFATANALITAILAERRIEFAAEGKRWSDIHRLAVDPVFSPGGIPAKMASGFVGTSGFVCGGAVPATVVSAISYSSPLFLWPIPQQERNTNPIVEQNPNY